MKIKQDQKLIQFKQTTEAAFSCPVIPASKALPDWYKQLSVDVDSDSSDVRPWKSSTLKGCMPMFDAMTQGYIIPLWSDIYVETRLNDVNEPQPFFTWPAGAEQDVLESHAREQTWGLPLIATGTGPTEETVAFKFISPWFIYTPKGYSTLFVSPLNNMNPNFEMVSGIVATDTYPQMINFPFVWRGPRDWKGVIPFGTPLIQLIPFKREDFRHEIGVQNEVDKERAHAVKVELGRAFKGTYKRLWRRLVRSV
jgi:hypothetical protein